MPRTLSPEERALWRRVTADVRNAAQKLPERPLDGVAMPSAGTLPVPSLRPRRAAGRVGTGLDHTGDRKLEKGEVLPDRVADLHGLRLEAAHRRALETVESAARNGERVVLLVTGRAPATGTSRLDQPLRGIIRASIEDWLAASAVANAIAAIRSAHPRHGGAGAVYVVLRRRAREQRSRQQKLS